MVCGALALSACGSGGSADAEDDQLPSLETADGTDDGDTASAAIVAAVGEMTADEAALALSECLRAEGIDVPDIGLDADGNVDRRGAFEDLGPTDEAFRDAMDVCREVVDDIAFGGGGQGALAEAPEVQDSFLEFSDCVRTEGFEDVPDLDLGAPGSVQDGSGIHRGLGEGDHETGFGDRTGLYAESLGLDPEDPAVIAAFEVCLPIIDQAYTDAGAGD